MRKHLFARLALAALLSVGLYAFAAPAPTAHAAPPTSHTITRMSGSLAYAEFSFTQGDITSYVTVFASPEGVQQPTPVPGPTVAVSIYECALVGETVECAGFVGMESAPGLRFDTHKLTSATLPETTVPVSPLDEFGNPSGPPVFDVSLALTWTGVGAITTQSQVSHTRIGHTFSEIYHSKGAMREATVVGTISYPSPHYGPITLTGANSDFAFLMSQGSMDITIQR